MTKKFIVDLDDENDSPEVYKIGKWVFDVFQTENGSIGFTVYPYGTGEKSPDAIIAEVTGEGKCADIIVGQDLIVRHG